MSFSTLTGAIRVDASGVKEGVDEAEQEVDSLTGRMQSAGQTMQSAGTAMTAGITAPLLAMGGMSARAAGNFDQSMQQSIAVMGEVSDTMREDLEQTARDVANTTTVTAQEAANAYYYLASAGLDASQAMEAMPRVAEFAEAGQMKMAEATDVATNVMSAFGYQASEMTEVTDTLTATVSNHNQTMTDMSTAMSTVAPIASSLGISIQETSAAIGQMGDVGIQGERAGTALRNVLSQLSDEGSTVTKQLEQMGVQTRDSSGDVLSLTQILRNMESAGVEAGDAAKIFGTEAGPAMAALMKQGASALSENTSRIREAEGATKSMAETQRDTLNAEMQIARSNVNDAGIAIGTVLMPMLSTATGYVKDAANWFGNLNSTQQKAIVVAGGLAAALGPVLLAVGTLLTALPAMSTGWTMATGAASGFAGSLTGGVIPAALATQVALGPITVPIWAIIAAIGALVAAFATDFMSIRSITEDVASFVIKSLRGLAEGAIKALNNIPGVNIDVEDLPTTDDITSALPSPSDLNPVGTAMGKEVGQGVSDGATAGAPGEVSPGEMGLPGPSTMEERGQSAGSSYQQGLQKGIESGEEIRGEVTPEMRELLVEGVEGYENFDSTEEVEDAPTPINDALFEAMSRTDRGATPETLGVSEAEFKELVSRHTDLPAASSASTSSMSGSGSSASGVPPEVLQQTTSSSQSQTKVVEKLDKLISLMKGLTVEGELDVDDAEWEQVVDPRVRVVLDDERDRFERGVGS